MKNDIVSFTGAEFSVAPNATADALRGAAGFSTTTISTLRPSFMRESIQLPQGLGGGESSKNIDLNCRHYLVGSTGQKGSTMFIKSIVRFVVCAAALTTVKLFAQVNSFHITQTNPGASWTAGVSARVTQQGTLRYTNAGSHIVDVTITGRMSHSGSGGMTPVNSSITLGNLTIVNGGMAGTNGNSVVVGPGTTITVAFTAEANLTATTPGNVTVTGTAEAKPDGSAGAPASGSGSVPVAPAVEEPQDEEERN